MDLDLEQRLINLKALRKGIKDADVGALDIDIRNVERALETEREMRASASNGVFPPSGRPAKVVAPSGESDTEFRQRAARELERVAEV
jgi:hypothetical protein